MVAVFSTIIPLWPFSLGSIIIGETKETRQRRTQKKSVHATVYQCDWLRNISRAIVFLLAATPLAACTLIVVGGYLGNGSRSFIRTGAFQTS